MRRSTDKMLTIRLPWDAPATLDNGRLNRAVHEGARLASRALGN